MDVGVGGDVGVGVPLVLVDVRQDLKVALQDRLGEAPAGPRLHDRQEPLLRLQQIAAHVDLADVERIALFDGNGDEDEAPVGRELDGWLAELHVQIAAIVIHALQHVLVAGEGVLAIGARAGEEAPEASLLGDHRRLQLVGGDGAVSHEPDLLHRHLGVLVDDEDDVDLVVGQRIEAPGHLGEEVALLDVFLLHLLRRPAHGFRVEDLELLDLDRLLEIVPRQLLVSLQLDLADGGLLADQHRELIAGARRRHGRHVQLDVVEVPHLPGGEQRVLQLAPVEGVALLEGERGTDCVGLHPPVALDVDLGDDSGLRGRRGSLGGGHPGGNAGCFSLRLRRLRHVGRGRLGLRGRPGSGLAALGRRGSPAPALRGGWPKRRDQETQGREQAGQAHVEARTLVQVPEANNEICSGSGRCRPSRGHPAAGFPRRTGFL